MLQRAENWRGVPRIWTPAVVLSITVGTLNDSGYTFCQACGKTAYKKVEEKSRDTNIKDVVYNERVYFLENLIESSPYNKKKTVLEREFIAFLSPLPLSQASPVDICRFLGSER